MSASSSWPEKRRRVWAPHVRELNALVEGWRVDPLTSRSVPWFDPDGPGTRARALVLLESPAPRTVAAGDLGFSSMDNLDVTSTRLREAMAAAGLDPRVCLRWNAVPWALTGSSRSSRTIGAGVLEEARPALTAVVSRLPELRVVVAVGGVALTAWMRYLTLEDAPVVVPTLAFPHPSPANGHRQPEARERMLRALRLAAALVR